MVRLRGIGCAALLLSLVAVQAAAPLVDLSIEVAVVDTSNQPVAGVRIDLKTGQTTVSSAVTDPSGRARFAKLNPARYEIAAAKEGFEAARKSDVDLSRSVAASIELTLIPALARERGGQRHGHARGSRRFGAERPARPYGHATSGPAGYCRGRLAPVAGDCPRSGWRPYPFGGRRAS
jgi:Carboxypeptidase regulatory-like domain